MKRRNRWKALIFSVLFFFIFLTSNIAYDTLKLEYYTLF